MVKAALEVEFEVMVALQDGPSAETPTWTDLSDRVISIQEQRGRRGAAADMAPGSMTITFDNSDDALDPLIPGSIVELAQSKGLPGCQARVRIRRRTSGGSWGSWKAWFRGYIGEDAWRCVRPTGRTATSSISLTDKKGLLSGLALPESVWGAWAAYADPWIWFRAPGGDTLMDIGSKMQESSRKARDCVVFGPSGPGIKVYQSRSRMPASSDAAYAFAPSVGVQTVADSFVFGEFTIGLIWECDSISATQNILSIRSGGVSRFRIAATTSNKIVARFYDSSGNAIGDAAEVPNVSSWADGQSHYIACRYNGSARTLELWVDAFPAGTVSGSSHVPGVVTGSVRIGGGPATDVLDEVIVWNEAKSTLHIGIMQSMFGQVSWPWGGDSLGARVNRFLDLAQIPRDGFDNFEYHRGTDDADLMSLRQIDGTVGAAIEALAQSGLGTWWTTRSGRLRVRTRRALSENDYAAHYATPIANLTDEPTPAPSPRPVRRAHPTFSGGRASSVVTVSRFTWQAPIGLDMTRTLRNQAGIDKLGERVRDWTSWAEAAEDPVALALTDLQDHDTPRIDMETVKLSPLVDEEAVRLIVDDLELETAIDAIWHDQSGQGWQLETAVQGWSMSATPKDLTMELVVAPHPSQPPVPIPITPTPPGPSADYSADWSSAWDNNWQLVSYSQSGASGGSLSVSGGKGFVYPKAQAWSWALGMLTGRGALNDFEMLVGIDAVAGAQPWIAFGQQSATGSANPLGYVLLSKRSNSTATLYRIVGSTWSVIGTASASFGSGAFWVRVRREGTDLKIRLWDDGDQEPGSWEIDITDATYADGYVGIGTETTTGGIGGVQAFTHFELTEL